MNPQKSLSSRTCAIKLLNAMKDGIYSTLSMLPPEVEIAERLSVSRTMIRDALSTLEREGFISRKRGKGTVINRHVLNVRTRIDLEKEFLDMIRDVGYIPKSEFLGYRVIQADCETAKHLMVEDNSQVLAVGRVIWAEDTPVIYCIDYIPGHLFNVDNLDESLLKQPIFNFLHEECKQSVHMDLSEIYAIAAEGEIADCLKVPYGSPLLKLSERGYSFDGRIVLYSDEYYSQGKLVHTILRKKI